MNKQQAVPAIIAGLVLTLAATLFIPSLFAHGGPGHGGAMMGNVYFDPDTIQTISGTLENNFGDWQMYGNGNHTGGGMGFTLKADSGEEYDLMLAPYWYLEENGIFLEEDDRVTITGSIIDGYIQGGGHHMGGGMGDDDEYLIATELQFEGSTLQLRDERGYPVWSGGGLGGGSMWFDPETVTTVNGTFTDNLGMWSAWGVGNYTGNCMHLVFKAEDDTEYYAMLGPWWYLEENGIEIESGLEAKIKGSVVQHYWQGYDDFDYIIAMEITVNGTTVQLRDENGIPLWYGTGWHYYSPTFDNGTKDVVTGIVKRIRTKTHGEYLDPGYELILRNDDGKYRVFVSPEWYAEILGMNLKKGDEVTVKGSLEQRKAKKWDVVATQIKTDEHKYRLRTNNGTPRWVSGSK